MGKHVVTEEVQPTVPCSAAFFGWLVATAVSVLLLALVGATAARFAGSSFNSGQQAASAAGAIGIIAGIVFLLVRAIDA